MARRSYPPMPVVIESPDGGQRGIIEVYTHRDVAIFIARGYRFPRVDLRRELSEWLAADAEAAGTAWP
jgi:hypothetical protein